MLHRRPRRRRSQIGVGIAGIEKAVIAIEGVNGRAVAIRIPQGMAKSVRVLVHNYIHPLTTNNEPITTNNTLRPASSAPAANAADQTHPEWSGCQRVIGFSFAPEEGKITAASPIAIIDRGEIITSFIPVSCLKPSPTTWMFGHKGLIVGLVAYDDQPAGVPRSSWRMESESCIAPDPSSTEELYQASFGSQSATDRNDIEETVPTIEINPR